MKTKITTCLAASLAPALILTALIWCGSSLPASAIIASPEPFEFTQPDGSKVKLRLRGDEFFHWHEDLKGFTVLRDGVKFVYAKLNAKNQLVSTTWQAGSVDPRTLGLTPGLLPPAEQRSPNLNNALPLYRPWSRPAKAGGTANIAASGTVKNLVILCKFSDHTFGTHTRAQADYDVLFNRIGGDTVLAPTGSVRDAYQENSYSIVTLESTVLAWVTLPQTMAYYAGTNNGLGGDYPNNAQKMVQDALALVDPMVDFGQFDQDADGYLDAIDIIHSGYGAERGGAPANSIWSHKSSLPTDWVSADENSAHIKVKVNAYHTEPALWDTSGTAITHIGVICHETGHLFGLPDLYDTDGQNRNGGTPSAGIGSWCMMANSWGFDNSQLHPPHFSAWCKIQLGWVTNSVIGQGKYIAPQAETSPVVFRIDDGFPSGEYLLIENRQPAGIESDMPQGGLCVWHIDEAKPGNTSEGYPGQPGWPGNNKHYKVALLQADGNYDMEQNRNQGDAGDVYHGNGQSGIGATTVPNTYSYQNGEYRPTGIELSAISTAGPTMTFCYVNHPFIFVDANYGGPTELGTRDFPFRTVRAAHTAAVGGENILIRGAYYAEAVLLLNKRVTLLSWDNIPATIGQ